MKFSNMSALSGAAILGTLVFALSPGLNAKNASDFTSAGLDEYRMGNFDGAIADCTKAITLAPKFADAYCNRGLAKFGQGNLDGALADFSKAIELKPDYLDAYYGRALTRDGQGNLEGAIPDYTKAIELKPAEGSENSVHAVLYRALLFRRVGRGVDEGLKASADWKNAWHKTVAAFLSDQVDEAKLLQQANAVDDTIKAEALSEAYFIVGALRVTAGDKPAARANFEKCLAAGRPSFVEYRLARGQLDRL